YNGYVSVSLFNLANTRATVEAVQVPTSSSAFAIFALANDGDNWFRIKANSHTISFQQNVNGAIDSVDISYNSAQHHYWRIRYDSTTGNIFFETSADNVTWTTQRTVTPQVSKA